MNLERINFNELGNNNISHYNSIGTCKMFTTRASKDLPGTPIKKGDILYFKVNSNRGVDWRMKTSESNGSCEDLAEVFCYETLNYLKQQIGNGFILKPTYYDFGDYFNSNYNSMISSETGGVVDSDRLYGCISLNCVDNNAYIVHGDIILAQEFDSGALKSTNNTIYNYEKAINTYKNNTKLNLTVDPSIPRFLSNLCFFDFLFEDADRHCKNINYQIIKLNNGLSLFTTTGVIDNGGALYMQARDCKKHYSEAFDLIKSNDINGIDSFFQNTYDLDFGAESLKNEEVKAIYSRSTTSYATKIALIISQNEILFNDFYNMYHHININKVLKSTKNSELKTVDYFIPNFETVASFILYRNKMKICKAIADILNIEFDENLFRQDDEYYLKQLAKVVLKDNLNIHIANDEELSEYNKKISELSQKSGLGE